MKQIREETGICHLRVADELSLKQFLLASNLSPLPLEISEELVNEWLHYGSVYVDGLRVRADRQLLPQQLIRLHTRRKSYVSLDMKLHERIALENEHFLILNKPAGLPTHPTLDNYLENAKVMLEKELGFPIYVTHRLDVATQGLLLMAKTPAAQVQINKLFSKRKVEKFYRCLLEKSVPLGLHEHFMDPDSRIPKTLDVVTHDNWWLCQLEVLSCTKNDEHYSTEIRLLTGRTHQIRAQMSYLGAPIVGDSAYGSVENWDSGIALECCRLNFMFSNTQFDVKLPSAQKRVAPSKITAKQEA